MKKQNLHLLRDTAEQLIKGTADTASLAELIQELDRIKTAVDSNTSLLANLSDKAIPLEKRESALFHALNGLVREDVLVAMLHLLRHDALRDLSGLVFQIERMALERGTLSIGELKTAETADEAFLEQLTTVLKEQLKKDVVLKASADPKLIGGFILTTETTTVDGSVRGTIDRLKQTLSE